MKRIITLVPVLCIIMMCASPIEAQGQPRGQRRPEPPHRTEYHHRPAPHHRPVPPPPAPRPRHRPMPAPVYHHHHHAAVMDAVMDVALTAITVNACREAIEQATEIAAISVDRNSSKNVEIGTLLTKLPGDCEKVVIDNKTYYQVDDILYKVTVVSGTPYFEAAYQL